MMKIPVAKPYLGKEEAQSAYDTVLSHWVTQGPRVAEFEENFAKYVGSKYAVAVSNCTTALHLCMVLHNIGPGDEVICPSTSYIATANCIKHAGATPVFCEVGPDHNAAIEDVEKRITPKTKAILLVHQIGMPGDIDAFQKLCDERGIALIEDAACAAGSSYNGTKIGGSGNLVCFSFHPRKVITTGDGGMISTNNKNLYNRAKLLRQHGMSVNDRVRHESQKVIFEDHLEVGFNYRMTDIQAAVGIIQLDRLDFIVAGRRAVADRYLKELAHLDCIRLPKEEAGMFTNWQSFSMEILENSPLTRDELMQKMLDSGIATRRGVRCSHLETAYKHLELSLPYSEKLHHNSIILPLYIPMSEEEIDYVIAHLLKFLG